MSAEQRSAQQRWAEQLQGWAVPQQILDQAPVSPWQLPVELFTAPPQPQPATPSARLAAAALPAGGSVLDVGCGGGRAAMALADRAALVIGVDRQPDMLSAFAAAAGQHGLAHLEVRGDWPEVAGQVPVTDVALAHHVVYNVARLTEFVTALAEHARHRVVLELTTRHPLAHLAPYWRHFWGLERPAGPGPEDLLAVLREAGLRPQLRTWSAPGPPPDPDRVRRNRIRLCLTEDRDAELAGLMAADPGQGDPPPRELATVWWDRERLSR